MQVLVILLSTLVVLIFAEETKTSHNPLPDKARRTPRNYDSYFKPGSDEDETADAFTSAKPTRGDQEDLYKGYYKFPSYGPWGKQSYDDLRGVAYHNSEWRGVTFPDTAVQMMSMLNSANKLQGVAKKDEQGFLASLFSDHKSLIAVAVIPLTIILVSIIPLLMNKFMSSTSLPGVVETIASSKMGRAFSDPDALDNMLQGLIEFAARSFEEDECIQETLCRMVISKRGLDNSKKMAVAIRRLGQEGLLKQVGINNILKAMEKGSCKNVCERSRNNVVDKGQIRN